MNQYQLRTIILSKSYDTIIKVFVRAEYFEEHIIIILLRTNTGKM